MREIFILDCITMLMFLSTLFLAGPDSSCSDTQLYAQHLIRTLGGNFYVGQLALILISHKIKELGESLLLMDPFNDAFPAIHDCLFVMYV